MRSPVLANSRAGDRTHTYPNHSSESVIRVFNIPAITWALTVILLLSGSYHILQAIKSHQRTDQINKSLHALMNVLMAGMLWNFMPSTMLAQITVLGGAALWFVIQAVARPEFKTLCAGSGGRLQCVYHSLSMAGGAIMILMMGQTATAGSGTSSAGEAPMSHAHHAVAAGAHHNPAIAMGHSPVLATLLTVFFGVAAVIFLALLLGGRVTARIHRHPAPQRFSVRSGHGLEALGAAIMALMFATMTA